MKERGSQELEKYVNEDVKEEVVKEERKEWNILKVRWMKECGCTGSRGRA